MADERPGGFGRLALRLGVGQDFGKFDSRFACPWSERKFFEICGTTRESEPLNADVSCDQSLANTVRSSAAESASRLAQAVAGAY